MNNDIHGYYSALGIKPCATSSEVKKAYRLKAMQYHPDRNPNQDTTAAFQKIQKAYNVLGDASARAAYDELSFMDKEPKESSPKRTYSQPLVCSVCGCISAQPRYIIFTKVVSYIFFTNRSYSQGIFCPQCAAKTATKHSLITWLFGWWGFPWGVIYSIQAICKNFIGGEQPEEYNLQILAHQATFFFNTNKYELARAIASDALTSAKKIKIKRDAERAELGYGKDESIDALVNYLESMLELMSDNKPIRKIRSQWGLDSKITSYQLLAGISVIGSVLLFTISQDNPKVDYPESEPLLASSNDVQTNVQSHNLDDALTPTVEPSSGVMKYTPPVDRNEQLPTFRLNSADNGPSFLIKLINTKSQKEAVAIYLRKGESIDLSVPFGSYTLKMASGYTWFGEEHLFGNSTNYFMIEDPFEFKLQGDQLLGHSLTLKNVINGNVEKKTISPDDF